MTVPPPKVDAAWTPDDDVEPRDRERLLYALMEARDCAYPDAEAYLDEHGAEHCERLVRQRWRVARTPGGKV